MASTTVAITNQDQDLLIKPHLTARSPKKPKSLWKSHLRPFFVISSWIISVLCLILIGVLFYQVNYRDSCQCVTTSKAELPGQLDTKLGHSGSPQAVGFGGNGERTVPLSKVRSTVGDLSWGPSHAEFSGGFEDFEDSADDIYNLESEDYYDESDDDYDNAEGRSKIAALAQASVRNRRDTGGSGTDNPIRHSRGKKNRAKKVKPVSCKLLAKDGKLQMKSKKDKCLAALNNHLDERIQQQSRTRIAETGAINAAIQVEANITEEVSSGAPPKPLPYYQGAMYNQGFVPGNETLAFWTITNWSENNEATKKTYTFHRERGAIEVKKSGLYYVYAQVNFHTTRAHVGYHVMKHGRSVPMMSCLTGVDHVEQNIGAPNTTTVLHPDKAKYKSCSTNGVLALNLHDQIYVNIIEKGAHLVPDSPSSYLGMIKIK